MKISPTLKCLLIWIDVKQSTVILNEEEQPSNSPENSEGNSTIILLPRIQCKCKELNDIKEFNLNFPINKISKEWKSTKSTFPWLCSFNDLAIKTKSTINLEKYFVHAINANITLALDDKKYSKSSENEAVKKPEKAKHDSVVVMELNDRSREKLNSIKDDEILAFNLHIDTKPIFIEVSEDQALILRQTLPLLMRSVHLLSHREENLTILRGDDVENESQTVLEEATIKEIKDFLASNTNSEAASSHTITNYSLIQMHQTIIFLLMQWTVTKITFSLKGCSDMKENRETKMNFDFEDFIVSIDCQLDYFKFKCKIGSLSMQYLEKDSSLNSEWKTNDYFKAKVRAITEDTQHHHHQHTSDTFFDLTLTIAETSDYFKRLGIGKNLKNNLNKSIEEIDMHIKGIDILLDLNKFEKFIPLFYCLSNISSSQDKEWKTIVTNVPQKSSSSTLITDLPLLFAQSQGITIYIPVRTGKSWCDVFIFKIGEMHITPLVRHPLTRYPIRPDIYNKAAQLQILDIPGSKLEDRQYEFALKSISAATGNWKDILTLMKETSVKLKNTNPAFEWNHQSKKTSLELNSIFNDFLITVTYAPCMIYKNILVCGTAIEINCVTDLVVTVNTHQLHMMNLILKSLQNINRLKCDAYEKYSFPQSDFYPDVTDASKTTVIPRSNKKIKLISVHDATTLHKSLKHNIDSQAYLSERETSDSGIASSRPTRQQFHLKHKISRESLLHKSNQNELYIPYKIELVAGLFIFKLLQNLRTSEKVTISSETDDDDSLPVNFSPINDDLIPLISCTVKTSMLIEYKNTEFITKFFVYTININHGSELSSMIETLTGSLDNTGIPPALLTFEYKIRTFNKLANFTKTEIDCQFGRPIKIHLSSEILKYLFNSVTVLSDSWAINDESETEEIPTAAIHESTTTKVDIPTNSKHILRKTKIQSIRQILCNANKFSISTEKFLVEFRQENEYDIRTCFGDLNAVLTITERPEELSLYISADTLYIQTVHKMLLHPVRFKIKLEMKQEDWCTNPLLCVNSKFDVIHLDVGPQNIKNLMNAINDLNEILSEISKKYQNKYKKKRRMSENKSKDGKFNRNLLKKILLPEPKRKSTKSHKEEFYQDDLRAGAFQFVDLALFDSKWERMSTVGAHSLPDPYQIQIISRNNGIVCWCYPQPRRICKLQIYPVPMQTSQPVTIKCRMEYYSQAHADFLHYSDFNITETETKEVELPEEKITACIWRVIILQSMVSVDEECFRESNLDLDEESTDESDYISINDILKEDDHHQSKSNFILQPKALVACMRIDTAFSPVYIPKIKLFVDISLIQINLQTQQQEQQSKESAMQNFEMPTPLKKFKLTQNYAYAHTFLTFFITNSQFYAKFLKYDEFSVGIDFTFSVKCLDYCCLTMFNFIEDTNVKSLMNIKKRMDINFVIDTIKLNFSITLIHTLSISHHFLEKFFNDLERRDFNIDDTKKIVIWTRYVVCNCTQLMLGIGQSETNEIINIAPGYCVFYSFRSCCRNKELIFQFYTNNDNKNLNVIRSRPISIQEDGEQFLALGDSVLIVKIFDLSQTQKCILLKGQIQVISMTSNKFNLQFRSSGNYAAILPEALIDSHERSTIFGKCVDDEELYFRLRFSETEREINRWSGEIPLKSRKGLPWLVKIPIKKDAQFISFWVRVMRESINLPENECLKIPNYIKPIRILIVIYPMFVIQSNFPTPLTASISSSSHDRITLNGKGETVEIMAAATNETQHQVVFENKFPKWHGEDRDNAVLSFNNIDWDKFFSSDNKKLTITEFLDKISKPFKIKWPLTEMKESNIVRDIQSNQTAVVPLFKCLPHRDVSYSLMMTISPWCLLINTLHSDIKIKNATTDDAVQIDAGKIGTLFPIEDSFLIDLHCDNTGSGEFLCSLNKISMKQLQQQNMLQLTFCKNALVSKISIEYSFNDGLRVITLSSVFAIVNVSNHKLIAYPFCLRNGEKIDRQFLEATKQFRIEIPNESPKTIGSKGISLDRFYHFELNNQQTTPNTPYQFFVCLTLENDELSLPLPLNEPFNRKCFSLYSNKKSHAFAAVCIEKKFTGDCLQYYLFIYNDHSPVLLIDNQTHFSYYVAESKTAASATATTSESGGNQKLSGAANTEIIPECNENFVLWTHTLRPMCQTYYTPPSTYLTFPDAEKYHCDIILALKTGDENSIRHQSKKIQWTAPIHTGYRCEKYFNVPLHGDVKIVVCDKHYTIKVFIFYVSQQTEFCIKDLRTRLSDPTNKMKCDVQESTTVATTIASISSSTIQKEHEDTKIIAEVVNERKECNHELTEFPIRFHLFVNEINLNMWSECKKKPHLTREIFSMFIDDLSLTFNSLFRTLEIYANNLQVDNQLYSTGNYDFPVILCSEIPYVKREQLPTPANLRRSIKMYREKPLLMIHINFYEDAFLVETLNSQLNAIRVYVEDTFVNELKDCLLDPSSENFIHLPAQKMETFCAPGEIIVPKDISQHAMSLSELIKLRYIRIDPINVILSLHVCDSLYVGFDHSSLAFSKYERQNVYTVSTRFGQAVGTHYFSGFLFSCGWVVGSLEILGSPSGLARSFTTGIRDFVSMPIQGLFRGPWGFFVGISQGSVSLFRNITAGALNSVTKLAVSVSRNLDRMTLDEEHLQRTEALRRSRPQGVTQGLSRGLTGLGINLLGAIGGLSRHTLEAKSTVGVVAGLGKGLFGAIMKPISGAADLVALTGQGMLHSVGYNTLPEQRSHGALRIITAYPAECKILWQLVPRVLAMDQMLFYHEATLVAGDELKRAHLILTTTVLTVFDTEQDQLIDILPIERVQMAFDSNDKTLINIKLLPENDQGNDDDSNFTNERIMHFLRASSDSLPPISRYSLDDLLQTNQKTRLQWSLYVSEHLAQHLFGYLKLIKNLTKNQNKW